MRQRNDGICAASWKGDVCDCGGLHIINQDPINHRIPRARFLPRHKHLMQAGVVALVGNPHGQRGVQNRGPRRNLIDSGPKDVLEAYEEILSQVHSVLINLDGGAGAAIGRRR